MEPTLLIINVIFLMGILISVYGWGSLALPRMTDSFLGLNRFLFSCGMGLGIIAYLLLGIGLLRLWNSSFVLGLLAIGLLLGLREIWGGIRVTFGLKRREGLLLQALPMILGIILTLHILVNFLADLAPPLNGDTLSVYLYIPKLWVKSGGVIVLPDIPWSFMPFSSGMLSALGLLMGGESLSQLLVGFLPGVLATLTVYCLAKRRFSSQVALIGSVIFYCTPVAMALSNSAKADLLGAYFELLAILSFLNFYDYRQKGSGLKWIIYSAVFGGFALGTKYLSFVPIILSASLLVIFFKDRQQWGLGKKIKYLMGFFLVVSAVASPFYLRTFLLSGNPFYPLLGKEGVLAKIFVKDAFYNQFYAGPLGFFLAPWLWSIRATLPNASSLGPLFAFGLPFLFFLNKQNGGRIAYIRLFLSWSLGYLFLTFLTVLYPRNMLAGIGLLSICLGYAILKVTKGRKFLRYSLFSLLIVMLTFNFTLALWRNLLRAPKLPYLTGQIKREEFLRQALSQGGALTYSMREFINNNLSPEAKILLIGPFWPYYIEKMTVGGWDCIFLRDEAEIKPYLARKGATYIFVNPNLGKKSFRREISHLLVTGDTLTAFRKAFKNSPLFSKNFFQRELKLVFSHDGKYLFEWTPKSLRSSDAN